MKARIDRVGIHLGDGALRALAGEAQEVIIAARGVLPDRVDRARPAKDGPDVVRRSEVGVGDDRSGACPEKPGGVVVDPLLGLVEGSLGETGLGVAAGVAEMTEDDDRVGRELDLGPDLLLAEVLVGVGCAGVRIQAEPVLRLREERVAIDARPAVAMAEVDDHRRALQGRLDVRPGGVRRVDLDDVGRQLGGRGRSLVGETAVVGSCSAGRTDDEDDLRRRL